MGEAALTTYLVKRFFLMLLTLIGMSIIIFVLPVSYTHLTLPTKA